MTRLKRVRWKEGLVLRPHHFQQQDLFFEQLGIERIRALIPYAWGVLRLEVDPAPLDNLTFSIASLQAIFPDGTYVDVPANARVPSCQFDRRELGGESGGMIDVKVGIRHGEPGRPLVSTDAGPAGEGRFLVVPKDLRDVDSGEMPAKVELLEYNLRLFFARQPTDGYEVLPIARLQCTGDPSRPVLLARDYAPPVLAIGRSEVLMGVARTVVERLTVIVRALSEGGPRRRDPEELLLYQALSSSLPLMRELIRDGSAHPWLIYLEMTRLAGSLLFRSEVGLHPYDVPPYEHHDPAPSFLSLRDLILELCGHAPRRPCTRHEMTRDGDSFHLELPEQARDSAAQCFLQGHSLDPMESLVAMLAGAHISSGEKLNVLMRNALPGVRRKQMSQAPAELPEAEASGVFVCLDTTSEEWRNAVFPKRNLGVYVARAPKDLRLHLVVVSGQRV